MSSAGTSVLTSARSSAESRIGSVGNSFSQFYTLEPCSYTSIVRGCGIATPNFEIGGCGLYGGSWRLHEILLQESETRTLSKLVTFINREIYIYLRKIVGIIPSSRWYTCLRLLNF